MGHPKISRQPDTSPAAYVALPEEDHQCNSAECESRADVAIRFSGAVAPPHYQCVKHWPTTRSILVDCGYHIDYAPDALALLLAALNPQHRTL